jgi:tetratricopeptide (TPR) repeat protein
MHEELLSRAGRLAKDRADYWLEKGEPEKARGYYREAARQYGEATKAPGGHYYPGVNEATCWLLAQNLEQAGQKAEAVLARLKTEERRVRAGASSEDLMWVLASKGEALIVAGSKGWRPRAERAYREALDIVRAADRSRQIRETMFRQLDRILHALKTPARKEDAKSLEAMISALK